MATEGSSSPSSGPVLLWPAAGTPERARESLSQGAWQTPSCVLGLPLGPGPQCLPEGRMWGQAEAHIGSQS